jgi:hypothetical protein
MHELILLCVISFVLGVILLFVNLVFYLENTENWLEKLVEKFSLAFLIVFISFFLFLMSFETYQRSNSKKIVTQIGIGEVVSLRQTYQVPTYTIVEINNRTYKCLGYVPDAKRVMVIEHSNTYSGVDYYECRRANDE